MHQKMNSKNFKPKNYINNFANTDDGGDGRGLLPFYYDSRLFDAKLNPKAGPKIPEQKLDIFQSKLSLQWELKCVHYSEQYKIKLDHLKNVPETVGI